MIFNLYVSKPTLVYEEGFFSFNLFISSIGIDGKQYPNIYLSLS